MKLSSGLDAKFERKYENQLALTEATFQMKQTKPKMNLKKHSK